MNETKEVSPIGSTWDEFRQKHFSSEEIAASDFRVALIGELIEARKNGIDKNRLSKLSGVKRSTIEKIETNIENAKIDDVMKILISLGKTLAVVPIEEEKQE